MDTKTAITESGKKLGYDKLRGKQVEAMTSFLEGNDTFVSLPTGYGKSIIYAALPHAFDRLRGTSGSIVVCISTVLADKQLEPCSFFLLLWSVETGLRHKQQQRVIT